VYILLVIDDDSRFALALEGLSLPMSTTPEKTLQIDVDFIHRHTAWVAIKTP